jgi:hypothetical protein
MSDRALTVAILSDRMYLQRDWPAFWAAQFGQQAVTFLRVDERESQLWSAQHAYEFARLAWHFARHAIV